MSIQQELFPPPSLLRHPDAASLREELIGFREFGRPTVCTRVDAGGIQVPVYVNEFWTSRQRAASSLHEISYRACFKPQLPRFFIERLTSAGDRVHDPFMGRGTTVVEAALLGRIPTATDVNPLSVVLAEPRLRPPSLAGVQDRLDRIPLDRPGEIDDELSVFYHAETLTEICALRRYLLEREHDGRLDEIDRWIRMVAVNRLTGHSPGFFSVYTMPPNQAVSIASQRKINERRGQVPPRRSVPDLIGRKTRSLLAGCDAPVRARLARVAAAAQLLTGPGAATPSIPSESVALVVTSPPFLDVVQYATDNWLRCWFCGTDAAAVPITIARRLEDWRQAMTAVLAELRRLLARGGHVAFEVGEVRRGRIKLEEAVLDCGVDAGLTPELVLINDQKFTKTANCWGVDNNAKGTNSNRIVLFSKR